MSDSEVPSAGGNLADKAERYETKHARRLRALAYRMLGSKADAEDMAQEAWLRWAEVDESSVANVDAYLSRLVTNLCLDKLGSAAARREQYVGVWLPEPLLDEDQHFGLFPGPEQQAEFAQDVSVAFMLALERLSPLERAAFLLRDVFDMEFEEVAEHLGRSSEACRQLVSRARRSAKADNAKREIALEERQRLVTAFIDALKSQDASGLAKMLASDAVLLADGGGKATAISKPLHGGAAVAKVFVGFTRLPEAKDWVLRPARINGQPGLVVLVPQREGARVVQTITLSPSAEAPGLIGAIYVQRNPDKLGSAREWLRAQEAGLLP